MFKSDKKQQQQQRQKKSREKISNEATSTSSINSGGAFVVKRPAHLRSATVKKDSKGSATFDSSPNRLPQLNTALKERLSSSSATDAQPINSHTLIAVFPSLEEFVQEREILRNVLAELQQYFSDQDLDLECSTIFETVGNILFCTDEYLLLSELLKQPGSSAIVFIGDRYGSELLPSELTSDEYNAIREAAVELADDAAELLEQFYFLDRTKEPPIYKLMTTYKRDPEGAQRLCKGIKNCLSRALADGTIAQLENSPAKSQFLTKSFIELCANVAAKNSDSIIVNRRLKEPAQDATMAWMDKINTEAAERINALKNELASKLAPDRCLSFLLDLKGTDMMAWSRSKEAISYGNELAAKLTEKIKSFVLGAHPHCDQLKYSIPSKEYQLKIVMDEDRIHNDILIQRTPKEWVPRDRLDSLLATVIQRFDNGNAANNGLYVQIYGPPGSGKTAALCRLHQLMHGINEGKDEKQGTIVITRFVHLTDGSVFANELLRAIFITICVKSQDFASIESFQNAFHLSSVLASAKSFFERPNARPVLLLLDDINLLKFGRTLGRNKNNLRKLFPMLSIVCTSNSVQPILGLPHNPELFELNASSIEQAISIIANPNSKRFTADQIGILRKQLQSDDINLVLSSIQWNEIIAGHKEISASLDAILVKAEKAYGADNVRLFCEFLCCAPCGLSGLELVDAFRLRNYMTGFMFEPLDVLNPICLLLLRHFYPLLETAIVDQRRLYFFRSVQLAQAAQQRYLQSVGDIKLANETLAKIFIGVNENEMATGNEAPTIAMVFPRPLLKDTGLVDIRRARNHWHYLLRTGDVDALKRECLCNFLYLEASFRTLGLARILSIFEECLQQILDNDLLCILEGILLPAISTLCREPRQFVSEFLNRLRYTRAKNSEFLNRIVEQAMQWTDSFDSASLLVPLTTWIPPPKMKQVLTFTMPQWKSTRSTILQPTYNHQHLLVAGNELAPGCVYMYHIASQLLVRTFSVPNQSQITSLCASKFKEDMNPTNIISAGNQQQNHFFTSTTTDGKLQIWSFTQAEQLKSLEVCASRIHTSILSSDDKWIALGSADSCARIILLDSGKTIHTFKDHTGPVIGIQLSSDDSLLITGSGDFAVMVWDIDREIVLVRLQGLMAPVTCLALTKNDAFLAVACEDETLRVFSLVSAQELHELVGHEARVNALQASTDCCKLFAGTKGKVLVYDIHNGQLLEVLLFPVERQPITTVRISDDDSFILAAAGDRVNIWAMNSIDRDVAAMQQKEHMHMKQQMVNTEGNADEHHHHPEQLEPTSVSCIQISPDEKGAGCGTIDGIVAFWDLDICQCMWTSNQQRTGKVMALGFSIDSFMLISGSQDGNVSLWETSTGSLLKQLQLHAEPVTAICVFVDGMRVLSCDAADNAYLWSLASLEEGNRKVELIASIANMHPPLYVRLSDTVIIAQHASNPKEMNIWALSGDRLFTRSKVHHNEPILCYAVNRSGSVLITGSKDLSLKLWQMDTGGLLIQVLVGHEDIPTCCCVSEDAQIAVSGAQDRLIIVWDVQTGSMLHSLKRVAISRFLEISLDATVFCSSGEDGWLEAWHISGTLLSAFNTHKNIDQLIMGADGDRILVKLTGTAQLPIICLHNTPANLSTSSASRYERVLDATGRANSPNTLKAAPGGLNLTGLTSSGSDEGPLGDAVANEKVAGEPVTSRISEVEQQQKQQEMQNKMDLNGTEKLANVGNTIQTQTSVAVVAASSSNGEQQHEQKGQRRTRTKLCALI